MSDWKPVIDAVLSTMSKAAQENWNYRLRRARLKVQHVQHAGKRWEVPTKELQQYVMEQIADKPPTPERMAQEGHLRSGGELVMPLTAERRRKLQRSISKTNAQKRMEDWPVPVLNWKAPS